MQHLSISFLLLLFACGDSSSTETQASTPQQGLTNKPDQKDRNSQPPMKKCQLEINSATEKEMRKLDQVGPTQAQAILNYLKEKRSEAKSKGEETWNFKSWADLYKVEGITEATCEKNKSKLCINGRPVFGCKAGP